MPDFVISLFTQIPLVGLFIWVIFKMQNDEKGERLLRDKEWRDFMQQQWFQFQEFLKEERSQRRDFHERVVKELREVGSAVGIVTTALNTHDNKVEGVSKQVEEMLYLQRLITSQRFSSEIPTIPTPRREGSPPTEGKKE